MPGEATLQVRRAHGGYMFQLMPPDNLYPPVTESLAGDPSGAVERTIATRPRAWAVDGILMR